MTGGAPSEISQNTQAVGLIYQNARSMIPCQFDNSGKVRNIPTHTENTVGNDEFAFNTGMLFEAIFQVIHVVVLIAYGLTRGDRAPFVNAGMVFAVGKGHIFSAQQAGDGRLVRLVAGGHDDGVFEP